MKIGCIIHLSINKLALVNIRLLQLFFRHIPTGVKYPAGAITRVRGV